MGEFEERMRSICEEFGIRYCYYVKEGDKGEYVSKLDMFLKIYQEAKEEFPNCLKCKYGERNEITLTGCTLDIGLRDSYCPKDEWFKKWLCD